MPTKIIIEDAEPIEIPDDIAAQGDAAVIAAIAPYFPEAAGAEIERRKEPDGTDIIEITPSGKTKG